MLKIDKSLSIDLVRDFEDDPFKSKWECFHPLNDGSVVKFDYSGRFLAIGTIEGLIHIWEVYTVKRLLFTLAVPPTMGREIRAIEFSKNGRIMYAGTNDGAITVFDLESQRILLIFSLPESEVARKIESNPFLPNLLLISFHIDFPIIVDIAYDCSEVKRDGKSCSAMHPSFVKIPGSILPPMSKRSKQSSKNFMMSNLKVDCCWAPVSGPDPREICVISSRSDICIIRSGLVDRVFREHRIIVPGEVGEDGVCVTEFPDLNSSRICHLLRRNGPFDCFRAGGSDCCISDSVSTINDILRRSQFDHLFSRMRYTYLPLVSPWTEVHAASAPWKELIPLSPSYFVETLNNLKNFSTRTDLNAPVDFDSLDESDVGALSNCLFYLPDFGGENVLIINTRSGIILLDAESLRTINVEKPYSESISNTLLVSCRVGYSASQRIPQTISANVPSHSPNILNYSIQINEMLEDLRKRQLHSGTKHLQVNIEGEVEKLVSSQTRLIKTFPHIYALPTTNSGHMSGGVYRFLRSKASEIALQKGPKGGIVCFDIHPFSSMIVGINFHGQVYMLQDYYFSDWPGPMFPPGFNLYLQNKDYDERESEFDLVDEEGRMLFKPSLDVFSKPKVPLSLFINSKENGSLHPLYGNCSTISTNNSVVDSESSDNVSPSSSPSPSSFSTTSRTQGIFSVRVPLQQLPTATEVVIESMSSFSSSFPGVGESNVSFSNVDISRLSVNGIYLTNGAVDPFMINSLNSSAHSGNSSTTEYSHPCVNGIQFENPFTITAAAVSPLNLKFLPLPLVQLEQSLLQLHRNNGNELLHRRKEKIGEGKSPVVEFLKNWTTRLDYPSHPDRAPGGIDHNLVSKFLNRSYRVPMSNVPSYFRALSQESIDFLFSPYFPTSRYTGSSASGRKNSVEVLFSSIFEVNSPSHFSSTAFAFGAGFAVAMEWIKLLSDPFTGCSKVFPTISPSLNDSQVFHVDSVKTLKSSIGTMNAALAGALVSPSALGVTAVGSEDSNSGFRTVGKERGSNSVDSHVVQCDVEPDELTLSQQAVDSVSKWLDEDFVLMQKKAKEVKFN